MVNLKEIKTKNLDKIISIYKLVQHLNDSKIEQEFNFLIKRFESVSFKLIVVGEFNRGKSTFINCLLENDILPTAEQETTATINILKYSKTPYLQVKYKNGKVEKRLLSDSELERFTVFGDFDQTEVDNVVIGLDAPLLEDGTEIIDTPGVNDPDEHRMEVTYGFIPYSDATLFLLDATQPFTESESEFLTEHILKKNIDSIIFLINKIDFIAETSIQRVMENVRQKILQTGVCPNPIVLPISSQLALEGIKTNNHVLIQKSFIQNVIDSLNERWSDNVKTEIRSKIFTRLLNGYAHLVSDRIQEEIKLLECSLQELRQKKEDIANSRDLLSDKMKDVQSYLNEDLRALISRIEDSLKKKKNDTLESLLQEVTAQQRDLNLFCEEQLPYRLKKYMSDWIERNEDNISTYLKFSFKNASEHFERCFSRKVIASGEIVQLNTQYSTTNTNISLNTNLESVEKVSFGVGAAVGLAFGIMTGGLSLVILPSIAGSGFLFKNLAGFALNKKMIENQKSEIRSKLPNLVDQVFSDVSEKLKSHVKTYYRGLSELFEREYEQRINEIEHQIDCKINAFSTESNKRSATIEDLRQKLNQINKLIKD